MIKNIYQTKIEQKTVNICKGINECVNCKCSEEECIAELYHIVHVHSDE